jgi:hypothetical protein
MMNSFGLLMGIGAFLLIGIGFPWVIYLERYGGHAWAPAVFTLGVLVTLSSFLVENAYFAGLLGIFGGTIIWGAGELKEQAHRCKLGWFKNHEPKFLPPWARENLSEK